MFSAFEKVRGTSACSLSNAIGIFLFPDDVGLPAFCPGKPSFVNGYIASGLQGIVVMLLTFLCWLGRKCEILLIKLPEDIMTWKGVIRALS